jgi:hypothetical protein
MALKWQRIPPNLADCILSQPFALDGHHRMHVCGCLIDAEGAQDLWIVCDRHQSTLYQAGRMLNG